MADIEVSKLINYETASDGTAVRINIEDADGHTFGIVFTLETATALLMTLPAIASSVIKRANNDPRMRVTYPLTDFQIESTPDNLRILTTDRDA
jgi:hypothetical protein